MQHPPTGSSLAGSSDSWCPAGGQSAGGGARRVEPHARVKGWRDASTTMGRRPGETYGRNNLAAGEEG